MKSSYDQSLNLLLAHEGGYSNHPADPGGPTNYGITIYDYRKYVKPDATAADVKAMQVDEAKRIYRTKYWDAQRCDDLPAGVDYAVFDYGVNSGIVRSATVLQRVLGVNDDGRIGPETLRAANTTDARKTINAICDERLRFLQGLRTWPIFGKGWGPRVAEVKSIALAMAAKKQPVDAPLPAPAPGKALKQPATIATSGGSGAVGAALSGAAAAQQGMPWWQVTLIAIAVLVAIAIAVHFISKKE